ncbi:hypothetical protein CP533_2241 [Ophiocordyceps camponoti-saundersi (nom. inval.)]|nr:hypothetical protein CP533_2241 [Ophiocordyceps camponoti-saundersi (nom. inval.)]
MLKIPYNRLHARGDVLFAARSGRIHSFSLKDGKHISTWQHPDHKTAQRDSEPPPAKRQRRDDNDDVDDDVEDGTSARIEEGDVAKGGEKTKSGSANGRPVARVPDRAVVTQLTSSLDGRYVVAVSGHDKIIWVFEHDGKGNLKQLSQRTMPKRPSAIAISASDSNIICADKFGDVYSLPLQHTPPTDSTKTTIATTARQLPNPTKPMRNPNEPAASTLTVHSKRNLEALKNQAKQLQQRKESEEAVDDTKEGKSAEEGFELSLLLGHVSMLTSLLLTDETTQGRKYIITADRDEHIRISRYAPQAHVIEAFCLGHTDFVNALVIPPSKPRILVSGGGDSHLITWDWLSGKQLSQRSILDLARQIVPETEKVAVTALFSLSTPSKSAPEDETYILAICEDINAIFTWHLSPTGTLTRPGAIELAAPPLDLTIIPAHDDSDSTSPLLIIAANPAGHIEQVKSLQAFRLSVSDEDDKRLAVCSEFVFADGALEAGETDASPAEIRQLLYTVENLRKQTGDGGQGPNADGPNADGPNADAVALSET